MFCGDAVLRKRRLFLQIQWLAESAVVNSELDILYEDISSQDCHIFRLKSTYQEDEA
jgi:hypothetical protein